MTLRDHALGHAKVTPGSLLSAVTMSHPVTAGDRTQGWAPNSPQKECRRVRRSPSPPYEQDSLWCDTFHRAGMFRLVEVQRHHLGIGGQGGDAVEGTPGDEGPPVGGVVASGRLGLGGSQVGTGLVDQVDQGPREPAAGERRVGVANSRSLR